MHKFYDETINYTDIIVAQEEDKIELNNIRKDFSDTELDQSIIDLGLINQIICRFKDGVFWLVGGERRFRAIGRMMAASILCHDTKTGEKRPAPEVYAKITVKVIVCEDDELQVAIAIADNIARKDLSETEVIDFVWEMDQRVDEKTGNPKFDRKEIAKWFDKSESWVSQSLSIRELPDCVRKYMLEGRLNRTCAVQLLKCATEDVERVLERAVQDMEESVDRAIRELELELAGVNVELRKREREFTLLSSKGLYGDNEVKFNAAEKAHRAASRKQTEIQKKIDRIRKNAKNGSRAGDLTSDGITAATEAVGARTGTPKALPDRRVRELVSFLDELMTKDKGKTKVLEKYSPRELRIMCDAFKLTLGQLPCAPLAILEAS